MKTYELIPLPDITPEARQIAVAWIEGYQPMGFDIQQKHKLASDIMNYAAGQVAVERERIKKIAGYYVRSGSWEKFENEIDI